MAASVCVETVLSKLLRLLFKDVLLRNSNKKQHRNKKFFIINCTSSSWELATLLKLARLQFTYVLLKLMM